MVVNYSSLGETSLAEKVFASTNSYCLGIQRTNCIENNPGGLLKSIYLSCVHRGKPSSNAHFRISSSIRLECPFTLRISRDNIEWTSWSSIIINNAHNHEATEYVKAYPTSWALTETERNTVYSFSSIGAFCVVIIALCQQDAEKNSIVRDIYNFRASKNRKMLDGRLPVEALLDTRYLLTPDIFSLVIVKSAYKVYLLFPNPPK